MGTCSSTCGSINSLEDTIEKHPYSFLSQEKAVGYMDHTSSESELSDVCQVAIDFPPIDPVPVARNAPIALQMQFLSYIVKKFQGNTAIENSPSTNPEQVPPRKSSVFCVMCHEFVDGPDLFTIECGHQFCRACTRSYMLAEIESVASLSGDDAAGLVRCPHKGDCPGHFNQSETRALIGEDAFVRLDRQLLDLAIQTDPRGSLHSCPAPNCSFAYAWEQPAEKSTAVVVLNCSVCSQRSCMHCKVTPFHDGITCKEAKKRVAQASVHAKNEQLTAQYFKKSGFKNCKRCHVAVEFNSGCLKMKCRCGYRFCYKCESENAQCACTPANHGFWDNETGRGDFRNLRGTNY
jgi:hypothetical protein